jgi:hypothetical protein
MELVIDDELRNICREIQQDNRTVADWAEIEASDWFQTAHYCGGFDATEMKFAFTLTSGSTDYCFSLTLEEALCIADGHIMSISLQPSPWAS